jgi:hypothetical protein
MLEDGGQRHERTATVCVAVVQARRGVETWLERCDSEQSNPVKATGTIGSDDLSASKSNQ